MNVLVILVTMAARALMKLTDIFVIVQVLDMKEQTAKQVSVEHLYKDRQKPF